MTNYKLNRLQNGARLILILKTKKKANKIDQCATKKTRVDTLIIDQESPSAGPVTLENKTSIQIEIKNWTHGATITNLEQNLLHFKT